MFALLPLLWLSHVGPEIRTEERGLGERHALHRADLIANVRYELEFSLDAKAPEYTGTSSIVFTMHRPAPITVDFDGGKVIKLIANRKVQTAKYSGRYLEIPAEMLVAGVNELEIQFSHPYSSDGVGLTRWVDPEDQRVYLFTDFEPYLANTLFPCFDQPDLKATYRIDVEAPKKWQVITGAPDHQIEDLGSRNRWMFQETQRFSTYLFSLHAGEYAVADARAGDVPLRLYSRQALAKYVDAEEWFDITRRGLEFFSKEFGVAYPFGKYDQVIAPAMNYEAMENVGAVTFSENFVFRSPPTVDQREKRARVILHEMAHMWFGNLVTMRWWDDLWLNESFATHLASLAVARATTFTKSELDTQVRSKHFAYLEDQQITTHPIEAIVRNTEDAFSNFDSITYGKGAAALAQISFAVSEEKFREGVRLYFSRHAFANADRSDFIAALEEAANVSLAGWTEEWLRTAGVNGVRPELKCEGDTIASLDLLQTAPERHSRLRTHRTRVALFSNLAQPDVIDVTYSGSRTRVDAAKGKPCPLVVLPNYDDHDYVKLLLDPITLATVKLDLRDLRDPLARAMLWHALWEMVRDAKLSMPEFLEIAYAQLPDETEPVVLEAVLAMLHGGEDRSAALLAYLPPGSPDAEKLDRFLEEHTAKAQPDLQKTWFDAYVACASSRAAALNLVRVSQGFPKFPGLVLDQDRRWAVLARVAALGTPTDALVKKELAKDPSDLGRRSALAVRASSRDEKQKKKLLAELATLPMADAIVVIDHLFPLGQQALHEKLLGDAFFTSGMELAKKRDSEFMSRYVGLIPATCTEKSVARLKQQVGRTELPDLLKRPLAVALEEDQRCLAARTRI
jgi:aminopeptidase N